MADEQEKTNWGGLIKGLVAGAAIVGGILLVTTGKLEGITDLFKGSGGDGSVLKDMFSKANMDMIAGVLTRGIGAVLAITGISYLLSDGSQNENTERHTTAYNEAKESFAIREDMRKMQTVMMARMKAQGHAPAMAMGNQQGIG